MSRRTGTVAALLFALAALLGPSAGSAAQRPTEAHELHVAFTEWALVPSDGLVASGPLKLTVRNYGQLRHRLDIIQTEWWGQKLDILHGRAVGWDVTRPIAVAPGQTRTTQVDLDPGSYLLLDNIRGHYALGAAVPIIVS
jgi:hypothetical protein